MAYTGALNSPAMDKLSSERIFMGIPWWML
ncbi:hypothetical protein ALT785_240076 [Alteromonas infernus]